MLAFSHSRRHRLRGRPVLLGVLGAPVVLGVVLVAVPAVMPAFGLMPTG